MPGPTDFLRLLALGFFIFTVALALVLLEVRLLFAYLGIAAALVIAWLIQWQAWREGRARRFASRPETPPEPTPPPIVEAPAPPEAPAQVEEPAPPTRPEPLPPRPPGWIASLRTRFAPGRPRPRPPAEAEAAPEELEETRVAPVARPPEERPQPEPAPEPRREPEPEPAAPAAEEPPPPPEPREPLRRVPPPPAPEPPSPAPTPESAPVVSLRARSREAREWNLWDLERLAREAAAQEPERSEEWAYLFFHLRQYATADGALPSEFDGLVRETFGPLLDRA